MNRYTGYISTAVSIAVLVIAISVLFGTFFDRPVLISYVTSESMEPTLMTGDIIFINPFVFSPGINDVIVFKSGNSYVVHRIAGLTQSGYITKGDNNIATDQLNGKPYVKKEDIAGKIVALGDWPVTIPHGGSYLKGISNALSMNKTGVIALLLILGLYLSMESDERREKRTGRTTLKIGFPLIYFVFSLTILVIIALSMVMVTDERNIEYATTSGAGKIENWYFPGDVFEKELSIRNDGKYPYFYKVEILSSRLSIADITQTQFLLGQGEEKRIVATVHAPAEKRLNTEKVRIWKYLPLLPAQAVELLFSINPYLPILAVDMELALLLVIVYFIIGGHNESPVRLRVRSLDRLRRELNTKLNLGGMV